MPSGVYERTEYHRRILSKALSKEKIKLICKQCDKEFEVRPYDKNRKYCSCRCYYTSRKGMKFSEERRRNISKALNSRKPSKEARQKMGENRLFVIDYEKLRELYIDKKWTPRRCGDYFGCNGETIRAHLLRKNIPIRNQKEARKLLNLTGKNNPFYGEHHTEEAKKKIREASKKQIFTKERIRKIMRRRIPTSLEEKFQKIVNKHNLPYKYVGNGSFIIERYNPDFINTNNEKIAIEVYARYHKRWPNKTIEEWKVERSKVFKKYGWQIIYFDETETNEENILNTLRRCSKL